MGIAELPPELQLYTDQHVRYIQSLDSVFLALIPNHTWFYANQDGLRSNATLWNTG